MLTKEIAIKTINKLPSSFSIDELIEKLIFMEKIDKGLKQSSEGKIFTKSQAKLELKKWLK